MDAASHNRDCRGRDRRLGDLSISWSVTRILTHYPEFPALARFRTSFTRADAAGPRCSSPSFPGRELPVAGVAHFGGAARLCRHHGYLNERTGLRSSAASEVAASCARWPRSEVLSTP